MFHRTLSALAAAALTIGTFAVTAPAQAAPADEAVTISLEGLDPADPSDAVRIDRRIRNAARDACGSQTIQPVKLMQVAAECEKTLIANARSDVQLAAARPATPFRLALRAR